MKKVILKPLIHRGKRYIGIYFSVDAAIQSIVQKRAGAQWSKTHGCWYIDDNADKLRLLKNLLLGKARLETPGYETTELGQNRLVQKPGFSKNRTDAKVSADNHFLNISAENKEALKFFRQQLILKAYSSSTIRTYTNEFIQFLKIIKDKPAKDFTPARLKDYLQYCYTTLKLSENTLHSRMNALKFY